MGAAIHADDLRTSASSTECVTLQEEVINQFSEGTSLKLNQEKLEVVKISANSQEYNPTLRIGNRDVSTSVSARCLGVWWNSILTAKDSVRENINKSRRSFFALGRLGAFRGDLNSLSSCSIFETCIVPTLL